MRVMAQQGTVLAYVVVLTGLMAGQRYGLMAFFLEILLGTMLLLVKLISMVTATR